MSSSSTTIPTINLSNRDGNHLLIVKACEEFGFFKVINHGVPIHMITKLESYAMDFFSLPLPEKKAKTGSLSPFEYRSRSIGCNGDVGWLEYLLMPTTKPNLDFGQHPQNIRCVIEEYLCSVKRMSCELLELMADGLGIQPRDVFSKLLMDEESDSLFRINHYPPCPQLQTCGNLMGFGEHTDPQIISVLRSNDVPGYQISLKDGSWLSVPPDENSFFINVGDSLQVMMNGRFKSVRHRVQANSYKSRLSMVYFGGPPMREKIAPLSSLMGVDQRSLYKEFTWFEYITSACKKPLAYNRLVHFEKIVAS